MPSSIKKRPKSMLRGFQVYIAKTIKKKKRVLISVSMSMGKTAAVLTVMKRLLNEYTIRTVLIVAPVKVAQHTWPEEIEAWEHLRGTPYVVIQGTPKKRLKLLDSNVRVFIINRELLPWLLENMKGREPFDMLIYDESSRLKSGKKRTTRKKDDSGKKKKTKISEFGALSRLAPLAEYVVLMSGTIAPNGLIDLWGQMYIIDQGARLGHTKKDFLDRWFESDYMGWKYTPRPYAHKEIMGRMKDVTIGLRAEDYMELPPKIYKNIYVELPPKIQKQYNLFQRTLVSEEYDVDAPSQGVLVNKLLQFANGGLYREDEYGENREVVPVHDLKLDAMDEIIANTGGKPLLVAYSYKFDRDRLLKKYKFAVHVEDDPDWKEKWDAGKIRMLIAHPASIGHGLNLQKGGNVAVWFGLPWSLELYQQFNQRLPRPGQEEAKVFIYHIIAKNTMDGVTLEALKLKGATQDAVTDAVRKRMEDILREVKL